MARGKPKGAARASLPSAKRRQEYGRKGTLADAEQRDRELRKLLDGASVVKESPPAFGRERKQK